MLMDQSRGGQVKIFSWNINKKKGNLDFSFSEVSHDDTNTVALIVNLRKLTHNNDDASIGKLAKICDEMPIDNNSNEGKVRAVYTLHGGV
jgi:hypothetical protein